MHAITYIELAVAAPVLCYFVVGLLPRSKAKDQNEYFIYAQQVDVRDYANTSVGYALQMAAIFLFAYWAILYGLGALWTIVFWFFGFWILKKLLPRFLAFHNDPTTMHGFIADRFGGGKSLRTWAAVATILGLWGTMMAEIDYTVQILAPQWPGLWSRFFIGAGFLIFGVAYILLNGYKAEVNTERIQVPVAYAALLTVLIATLPSVWQHAGSFAFNSISALLALCLCLIIGARLRYRDSKRVHIDDAVPILAIVALGIVYAVTVTGGAMPGHATTVLDQPILTQLHAQGIIGIISLLFANALWMPVDFSTWQRIASVKGENEPVLLSLLDRGTWRVMFESPATWILGIVLGLEIQGGGFLPAGGDANNGVAAFASTLAHQTAAGSGFSLTQWLYPLFIVASISIMMSTVHGIISAIAFTADKDLRPTQHKTLQDADAAAESVNSRLAGPRWITGGIMFSGLALYPLLHEAIGTDHLSTLLYAAYSMQLSLLVVVLLSLFKKNLNPRAALVSILTGFAFTILAAWAAISISDPDAAVLPPIFAVLGAGIGYVLAFKWRPKPADIKPVS